LRSSENPIFSENDIQKDNSLFRNLLDTLPIGVYSCDNQGLITYFNPAVEKIWGRTPKLNNPEDKFCGAYKLYDAGGNHIPHKQCFIARAIEHEVDYSGYELIVEQPDSNQLNVLGYANPMFDSSGNLTGVVNIMVDFTYQKMAEEEKHKKEKRALYSKKLESLGILSSGVAHSFNNLLTVILGNSNLALLDVDQNSDLYRRLNHIEESANSAAELSRKMLAYSGQGKFIVESLRIDDLIKKIFKNEEIVFEQATIKLKLKAATIIADAAEITQMINILVTNAIEALQDSPGYIYITTGHRYATREDLESAHFPKELPSGDYAYISVRDTGEGMDDDTMSKIFDPFFSTRFAGRGLGLAAALGIASGHSGIIKVESKLKEGSTFEVLLPCEDKP
jgi:PAS domain S-box-containing protein